MTPAKLTSLGALLCLLFSFATARAKSSVV